VLRVGADQFRSDYCHLPRQTPRCHRPRRMTQRKRPALDETATYDVNVGTPGRGTRALRHAPGSRIHELRIEIVESKLFRPFLWDGLVQRAELVSSLERSRAVPLVVVRAPAGYGKTTLLAQWADRDPRASAWLSVDSRDNDASVFLTHLAVALERVIPLGPSVFDALATPGVSIPATVVPRLGAAIAHLPAPVLLVLDDVHELHEGESLDALVSLISYLAEGSQLAMAGRALPPLPLARLQAERRVVELGPTDLAFDVESSRRLIAATGVSFPHQDVTRLHDRTEGWAAGIYLAALSAKHGSSPDTALRVAPSDNGLIVDYVESELLSRLSPQDVTFLTRTSVLERFSGPLCDAVLQESGSAATLERLARDNLFLIPLDGRRGWYRYHALFRDVLHAQLDRTNPDLAPVLLEHAAGWCEGQGMVEAAIGYAIAAQDVRRVVRLVSEAAFLMYASGRIPTLIGWFDWLDTVGALAAHPAAAAQAAVVYALTGRPAAAEYWREIAERGADPGTAEYQLWMSGMRSYMCRDGPERMLVDAQENAAQAQQHGRAGGRLYPPGLFLHAEAQLLLGERDAATACLEDVVELGLRVDAFGAVITANASRAMLAMEAADWDRAAHLIDVELERIARLRLEALLPSALLFAVAARHAAHVGDISRARSHLLQAQRLRPLLSYAIPWAAVQVLLELAETSLALDDAPAASTMLEEIDAVLTRRPRLGILVQRIENLRTRLQGQVLRSAGASTLTAAELRTLPLLSTHLTLSQVATRLFLSRSTIKTHVTSLYQKLDVHSRAEAVTRAEELGLLAP
jgi:LuxR family transcriptional regulator, maltose regulon positive regulatory protein